MLAAFSFGPAWQVPTSLVLLRLAFFGTHQKHTFLKFIESIPFGGHFGLLSLAFILALLAKGSLQMTIEFLHLVTSDSNLMTIFLHAFFQVALILFAFVLAMAEFHFVAEPWRYHVGYWPGAALWSIVARVPELLSSLPSRPHDYFVFLGILTMTCAFPTLAYLTILGVMCLIWPRWSWLLVRRIIFALTSNKKPVLDQLGDFCGAVAAALPLLAELLKH